MNDVQARLPAGNQTERCFFSVPVLFLEPFPPGTVFGKQYLAMALWDFVGARSVSSPFFAFNHWKLSKPNLT